MPLQRGTDYITSIKCNPAKHTRRAHHSDYITTTKCKHSSVHAVRLYVLIRVPIPHYENSYWLAPIEGSAKLAALVYHRSTAWRLNKEVSIWGCYILRRCGLPAFVWLLSLSPRQHWLCLQKTPFPPPPPHPPFNSRTYLKGLDLCCDVTCRHGNLCKDTPLRASYVPPHSSPPRLGTMVSPG